MKEQTNSFGKRLDELIEKRGITRREFAAKIDITEVSLSRWNDRANEKEDDDE